MSVTPVSASGPDGISAWTESELDGWHPSAFTEARWDSKYGKEYRKDLGGVGGGVGGGAVVW